MARGITDAVAEVGLPWMRAYANLDAMIGWYESRPNDPERESLLPIMYAMTGRIDEAITIIDDELTVVPVHDNPNQQRWLRFAHGLKERVHEIRQEYIARSEQISEWRTPLHRMAPRRVLASQVSAATPTAQQASIVREFKQAWEAKDINALVGLLDPDATSIGDGGGIVSAALRPIEGGEAIARAYVDLARPATEVTILERTVNGLPGLVAQQDGITTTVFAFQIADGRIKHIWAVRNPEKLRPWTAD